MRERQVFEVPRLALTAELQRRGLTGSGAEVGVAQGFFSDYILTTWPGKLYMVDRWADSPDYDEKYDQKANLDAARAVKEKHKPRATLMQMPSVEAAELFEDFELDFVYLDANHRYEEVWKDIEAWWPKVAHGGILAGDDYGCLPEMPINFGHGELTFGVKKAVDEWALREHRNISINWLAQWDCRLQAPNGEVFEVPARNWWVCK